MTTQKTSTKTNGASAIPSMPGIDVAAIKPGMPVVCSKDGQFGVIDHMEGKVTIKLNKDEHGVHHYMPLSWVTRVDSKVHVDRPGKQAMREWSTEPPTAHAPSDGFHAAIAELETVRDDVRVRIHLAGMELKDLWSDLDRRFLALRDNAPTKDEALASAKSALAGIGKELHELRAKLDGSAKDPSAETTAS